MKKIEDIAEEIYGTKVREEAGKLGISQKGKEIEELAQEVYEQKYRKKRKNIILICTVNIYIKY